MKSKQELKKEVSDFVWLRMSRVHPDYSIALDEWSACFDKMDTLGATFAQEDEKGWQVSREYSALQPHPSFSQRKKLWDAVWSCLATEAVHGKQIFEKTKAAYPYAYKTEFEKIKAKNFKTYVTLLERAHRLHAFDPKISPETLEKWVTSGWTVLLNKHLTEWGEGWESPVKINNDRKRKAFTHLRLDIKAEPSLAFMFVAQLRSEENTKTAIEFLRKHPPPAQMDLWSAWMLPMANRKDASGQKAMLRDRKKWIGWLAETQTVEGFRRVEPILERLIVQGGAPIPLSEWRHVVEREGLKTRVSVILAPEERSTLAL